MKRTKFQKGMALVLAIAFLLCGGMMPATAQETVAEKNSTVTDKSIADYQTELNTSSYSAYLAAKQEEGDYGIPASAVVISATEALDTERTDAEIEVREDGVYTPATGTAAWTFRLNESGWYSITLRYTTVEGRNTAIGRSFFINGTVPFKEAYSISLQKQYEYVYSDAEYRLASGDDQAAMLAKAAELGLTAHAETRDDGAYILYEMPEYWTSEISAYLSDTLGVRFLTTDTERNELRPTTVQTLYSGEYTLHDDTGYTSGNYAFALDAGEVTFALEGVNEPVIINEIILEPYAEAVTYEDYLARYANAEKGTGIIKIEAEYAETSTTSTVYAVEDRTNAACSPADPSRTVLNTIGGEQWETAGQALTYSFRVDKSGMYQITTRFKQDILEGLYVCRALSIFSGDGVSAGEDGYYYGVPFAEATELQFGYSADWQTATLHTSDVVDGSGNLVSAGKNLEFYFKAGVTYTVSFTVTLGSLGSLIYDIETALTSLNADYLTILKLTGAEPDSNRDYGFARLIPATLKNMYRQADVLEKAAVILRSISGTATANTATLDTIATLIRKMVSDPDGQIAKSLENFKSNLGTLGTFIGDAKKQPLQMDYITVQSPDEAVPRANANFFQNLWHEFLSFIWSFLRDYNNMGSLVEEDPGAASTESLNVWVAYGRDQSQVIRNLITNQFTPTYSAPVSLKLVASGTLLPSILAQAGPDVYLGLTQADVINYAVRSALLPIEDMDDFEKIAKSFNEAAMIVMEIEDSDGVMHCYGLPETELFYMMFVRLDILSKLNLEIPKTWTDVYAALPVLQAASMQFGMVTDYQILLYQNGGNLFADGGMRINLDSAIALSAFEDTCDFYTAQSCPYSYDAANRFRSGEIPIVIAQYTTLYNQLKVFATEIEGLWTIVPLPGVEDANGNINNCSIATTTAAVMVTGVADEMKQTAWNFMKWYTGTECQVGYSNDMASVLGESGKQPTANREALASLTWTNDEYVEVIKQFENLAAVPNYPGSYYIQRYTNFAFLNAYNNGADPRSTLLSYINTINNEITRKREEFELETLEIGQTLAAKRMDQASEVLDTLAAGYGDLVTEAEYAMANQNIKLLNIAVESLRAKASETTTSAEDAGKLNKAAKYLSEAATALGTYGEVSK